MAPPHSVAKPGKVVPDAQIVNELGRCVAHALGRGQHLSDRRQLEVRAEALDHLLALGAQAGPQQLEPLGRLLRHGVGPQNVQHGVGERCA